MANTSSPLVLRAGNVVAGKFRVERMLAEGGMGLVVAATHLHLEQPVALKFLRGDISSDWDALARFTREAQAAAQLKSEHVARVLDVGMTEDGTPYMVMEYLEGHSLARQIQTYGALDVASATEYAIQACEGLAEAHARGIFHRDIKPSNLFLVERSPGWRTIKILDFGISKFAFSEGSNITTGLIMGSPCYMSPEQLRSTATVDHRTDIWSLGATLHELLAGTPAFDPLQSLPALVATILERPAPPLLELRPNIPRELAAIVYRCLAKERGQRYESAADLAMALLPFAPARARVPAERAASMKLSARISTPPPRGDPAKNSEMMNGDPRKMMGPPNDAALNASPAQEAPPAKEAGAGETSRSATLGAAVGSAPNQGISAGTAAQRMAAQREDVAPSPKVVLSGRPPLESASEAPPPLAMSTPPGGADMAIPMPRFLPGKRLAYAVAALVLVVASIGVLRGGRGSNQPVPMAPMPIATEPPPPPPPTPPELSELVVRVSPASAQINIDGVPVAGNPFRGRYPKDESHDIRATANGYEPKARKVSLGNDVVVEFGLDRRAPAPQVRYVAPPPLPPARPPVKRAAAPAPRPILTSIEAPASVTPLEVDPAGGRAPLRPIDTRNPYDNP